jgi:hypothetical protein
VKRFWIYLARFIVTIITIFVLLKVDSVPWNWLKWLLFFPAIYIFYKMDDWAEELLPLPEADRQQIAAKLPLNPE